MCVVQRHERECSIPRVLWCILWRLVGHGVEVRARPVPSALGTAGGRPRRTPDRVSNRTTAAPSTASVSVASKDRRASRNATIGLVIAAATTRALVGTMPMPVFTFLGEYDFSGKTILPFCTHEGSGLGYSITDIRKLCPKSTVSEGLAIRGGDLKNAPDAVSRWLRGVGILT